MNDVTDSATNKLVEVHYGNTQILASYTPHQISGVRNAIASGNGVMHIPLGPGEGNGIFINVNAITHLVVRDLETQ